MDKNGFRGYWNTIKPKIKAKWNKFTDNDINSINGDLDKFLSKLHEYYGLDKARAEKELCSFCEACGCSCGTEKGHTPPHQAPHHEGKQHPKQPPQGKQRKAS